MASWQKALPVTEQTASPGVCVALLLFEASCCGCSPLRGYHVGRSILLPQFSVPHLHPLRDRPALLLLPDSPFFFLPFLLGAFHPAPTPPPRPASSLAVARPPGSLASPLVVTLLLSSSTLPLGFLFPRLIFTTRVPSSLMRIAFGAEFRSVTRPTATVVLCGLLWPHPYL